MSKNKYGDITIEGLQTELQDDATVEKIRKKTVVTINDSQRTYYVDNDGNIFEYEYVDLVIMEDGVDFYNRMADYRESILTVKVLDNMNIPENAYQVFDVSKEQNETIKAWLIENSENSGMYDLYIGGNDGVEIENCSCLFSELSNCEEIDLENLYTENATDFSKMFYNDTNLININLDNLDSSNVTTMQMMFRDCSNLKNIDLSNFTTNNLTNMYHMFLRCTNLENVDLSTFDTSNVTNMSQLFSSCKSLKKLDLEHFNVSKLSTWNAGGYWMFASCSSLEELYISSWDVSNLTNMTGMFSNCSNLQVLDLSGWNIEKVTACGEMFRGCSNLKTIYTSEKWGDNSQVTSSGVMFTGCTNLSGAIEYDSSKVDVTYANYDTGYFTYKATE